MKYLALLLLCACHDTTAPSRVKCLTTYVLAGRDTIGRVSVSPITGLKCQP